MKTVGYFEFIRKKNRVILNYGISVAVVLILFFLSFIIERTIPGFNKKYMKWPEILRNLLSFDSWSTSLWTNFWQIFILLHGIFFMYYFMSTLVSSLLEEDQLETMVYLKNAGVLPWKVFAMKSLFSILEMTILIGILLGIQLLLNSFSVSVYGNAMALTYYLRLYAVSFFYLTVAMFIAACKNKGREADSIVLAVVALPFFVSRIPSVLQFFSELLVITGRDGYWADFLSEWAGNLSRLMIISPLGWCFPVVDIPITYIIGIGCVTVILLISAVSIYLHKKRR